MNNFINWHKKAIKRWKKILNISDYTILWIAFVKGLIIGLLIYYFFIDTTSHAQNVKIIDGDTIIINGKKIRFSGIDTPELKQKCLQGDQKVSCGMTAKKLLAEKIGNTTIKCISKGKDKYKRTLAECFVNNESLSKFLVRSGYAFAYRKYSTKFIKDEDFAKENKLGMWSMKFQFPWDFRKTL